MQNAVSANEVWKDVIGYEGIYRISSIGSMQYFNRVENQWNHKKKGKKKGYIFVRLQNEDGKKQMSFNKIMTDHFEDWVIPFRDKKKNNRKRKNSHSKYKGVSQSDSKIKPFKARIRINGKDVNLGNFESEYHAARIHDRMWIKCG
jgi:hypothetical protein